MKKDITPINEVLYAFTEVIFDGTDAPFEDCINAFLTKPEHKWVKILAKDLDKRSAIFLFGANNVVEGMEMKIPDNWKDTLSGRYVWRDGEMRLANQEDIERWDGKIENIGDDSYY